MKTLITAADVKKMTEKHETTFLVQTDSIITPLAKDTARDQGIQFIVDSAPSLVQNELNSPCNPVDPVEIPSSPLDPATIAKIVGEVMFRLNPWKLSSQLVKEVDSCGLRLVKGNSVVLENYDTGDSSGNVKIKELFNSRESSTISAGFMTFAASSYSTLIKHDEFNYIIEGTLACKVNGKTYLGEPGDTLFLPAGTNPTFSTSSNVKLLYVSSLGK
ncbi:cupin domain-containing protein [Desulfosporosinus sp. PR]|uniref:cupin domain-containing protein n=1 Tax=Candidatus Desulfosporosinus nitrosoreducens TaxID=3401928 RepID=UPI0027EE768D|nr:cupin domain-containing protein [Desulfosporosinus sp. PR]MDQ7095276.1 cupin domain-containing protein [Desulfosporosinus sp. PR]